MNFYKDPLLEKLRLIESQILGEALSDEEFVELQRLRAELADDPEVSKIHSDVDAVVTARARDLEKPSVTTDPNKPPVDPNKKKPKYLVNPGTRACQHWLNSKGFKVAVDGALGPETIAAKDAYYNKYIANGKADDATKNEYFDMTGLSVAYNVRPTKTDTEGYMFLGSKTYLAAMKKYGYDPKTGDPIGGAKPASQAGQPTKGAEVSTGNPALDVLNKVPNPKNGMEYWVNGSRYKYTNVGFDPATGQANQANGWYKNLDPSDKLQWNANRALSSKGYTGPDDETAQNQFLASKKTPGAAAQPTKESQDLNRLKELLKF
jgi:hypothetical protein